jgi:hypothetical protein
MPICFISKWDWAEATYGPDSPEYLAVTEEDCPSTCVLPKGHDGPHEWTRDDEVVFTFPRPSKDAL